MRLPRGSRPVVFLAFDSRALCGYSRIRGLTTDAAEARGTVARAPERVSRSIAPRGTRVAAVPPAPSRDRAISRGPPAVSRSTDRI